MVGSSDMPKPSLDMQPVTPRPFTPDPGINMKDGNGRTQLHHAVIRQDESLVKQLISKGADVNIQAGGLLTPLHFAALGQYKDICLRIIKLLVESGADVFAKEQLWNNFMHELLEKKSGLTTSQLHNIAEFVIEKKYYNLFNTPNYSSATPLHYAVQNMEVEDATLSLLRSNGINFNAVDGSGESALFYAVRGWRSVQLLSNLIKHGADWKHVNKNKESLLHKAARWGNVDAMKYFLDLGLEVDVVDHVSSTPLMHVVRYGEVNCSEMISLLVERGANAAACDKWEKSARTYALKRPNSAEKDKIIELLSQDIK